MNRRIIKYISLFFCGLTAAILSMVTVSCSNNSVEIPDEPDTPETEENWALKEIMFTHRLTQYIGYQMWKAVTADDGLMDENFVFSPVSVSLTLSMIANGTDGNSRASLETLLLPQDNEFDVHTSLEDLNRFNNAFIPELEGSDFESKIKVRNSLWCNPSITLKPDFEKTLTSYYGHIFRSDVILNEFEQWCSEQTYETISKVFTDNSPAKLLVGSTLYLSTPLAAIHYDIADGIFSNRDGNEPQVKMLLAVLGNTPVLKTPTGNLIWVPLGESDGYGYGLQLVVALPNEGTDASFSNIFNGKDGKGINWSDFATENIRISLPKFSVESILDISNYSDALEINNVFGSSSDYSNMTSTANIHIDNLLHSCKIKLDDEGFKAADAVAGVTKSRAEVSEKKDVIVDGPFAFVILRNTKPILMGKICNL